MYELWARTPSEAKQWLEVLEKAASIGARTIGGAPGSRRGSNSSHGGAISSIGGETATTVPVVSGPTKISDDTLTVVAMTGKENMAKLETIRSPQGPMKTTSIVAAGGGLPIKWDDWSSTQATSNN